jgi:type I restriction enzyme M protein
MPIKMSELYSSLWQSCDELRGGMDASQYKDYVLVLQFVKYVSGLLEDAKNDKDKVTKASVAARLKTINNDREAKDERKVLVQYLALVDKQGALWSQANAAQLALTEKVAEKYGKLSEDEIKALVIDDKWLVAVHGAVQSQLDRVSQTLTGRVRELAERYATPLPELTSELETLAARVQAHLTRMGFAP